MPLGPCSSVEAPGPVVVGQPVVLAAQHVISIPSSVHFPSELGRKQVTADSIASALRSLPTGGAHSWGEGSSGLGEIPIVRAALWIVVTVTELSFALALPQMQGTLLNSLHTPLSVLLVDKTEYMVGSYGPRAEEYEFLTPMEEAPKGMLARGSYNIKSKFTDDDKTDHLSWEWNLTIKKDWKD